MKPKILVKPGLFTFSMVGMLFSAILVFFPSVDLPDRGFYMNDSILQTPKYGVEEETISVSVETPEEVTAAPVPESVAPVETVEPVPTVTLEAQTGPGLPVRLRIPIIGVDAAIEYVGLTPDGAMDMVKGPVNVAWYSLGPRHGEEGSAVIGGHFGWSVGVASVFDHLYQLNVGDTFSIEDANGNIVSFVVRETRVYEKDADATDIFTSSDGKAHLNLIACEGVWDAVSNTYSQRRVVFADEE